jgi:hypothetical protein
MAHRRIIRATTCRATAWRKSANTELAVATAGPETNCDALGYRVSRAPAHRPLVGFSEDLRYRPNSDFAGGDASTFVVSDGAQTSEAATIRFHGGGAVKMASDLWIRKGEKP